MTTRARRRPKISGNGLAGGRMRLGLVFAVTAGVTAGQRLPVSAVIGAALSLPVGVFAA